MESFYEVQSTLEYIVVLQLTDGYRTVIGPSVEEAGDDATKQHSVATAIRKIFEGEEHIAKKAKN